VQTPSATAETNTRTVGFVHKAFAMRQCFSMQ